MTPEARRLFDRYIDGSATAADERALARLALEDDEVFDLLSTIGLAREAAGGGETGHETGDDPERVTGVESLHPMTVHRDAQYADIGRARSDPRRLQPGLLWGGLAAAAVIVIALSNLGGRLVTAIRPGEPMRAAGQPTDAGPSSTSTAEVQVPTFLAANLELPRSPISDATFRSGGRSRPIPRPSGQVLSVDDQGNALVDLGALDGLVIGLGLQIEPAGTASPRRVEVAAVFRDQARLKAGNDVLAGQRVSIDATTHLRALAAALTDALVGRDAELVRAAASRASSVVESNAASADVRRQVLVQLAALARSRNDAAAALRYLGAAERLLGAAPAASPSEQAALLNSIGTVLAGSGDLEAAEQRFVAAQQAASPGDPVLPAVLNNLGAAAALRRDIPGARRFYGLALTTLQDPDRPEHGVITDNLAQVETVR